MLLFKIYFFQLNCNCIRPKGLPSKVLVQKATLKRSFYILDTTVNPKNQKILKIIFVYICHHHAESADLKQNQKKYEVVHRLILY